MRTSKDDRKINWRAWSEIWVFVGVAMFNGGGRASGGAFPIIWTIVTLWVSTVWIYNRFFGEVAEEKDATYCPNAL